MEDMIMPQPSRRKGRGGQAKRKGKTGGGQPGIQKQPESGSQPGRGQTSGETGEQDVMP
jgi:hypothetical protein